MNPILVTWAPAKEISSKEVTLMSVEAYDALQDLVIIRGPKGHATQTMPSGLLGELQSTAESPVRVFWLVVRDKQVWAYELTSAA